MAQAPDQPLAGHEVGPAGRVAAIVVVVAFTWLLERGFKALLEVF